MLGVTTTMPASFAFSIPGTIPRLSAGTTIIASTPFVIPPSIKRNCSSTLYGVIGANPSISILRSAAASCAPFSILSQNGLSILLTIKSIFVAGSATTTCESVTTIKTLTTNTNNHNNLFLISLSSLFLFF